MWASKLFSGCNLSEFEEMRTAEHTVTWPFYPFPTAHTIFQAGGPSPENLSV